MSHRVIAGRAKGHRLQLVPGDGTRPITDRAKEALFNIIGRDIYDAFFLDLFAGTGAVGIEALSRGATFALFTDLDRRAIRTIENNLKSTHLADEAEVYRMNAFTLLERPPDDKYEFIYVAPPQYKEIWSQALQALDANPAWLPEGTRVIVQIDPKEKTDLTLKHLIETDERRYGNTLLVFYEAVPTDSQTQEQD